MNIILNKFILGYKGRIIFAIVMPIFISVIILFVYSFRDFFICPLYVMTGLYCPGCGSGRTLLALVHFDFKGVFSHNILTVLAIPCISYYFLKRYLDIVFNKEILPFFKASVKAYNITIAAILIYAVLRNIRLYPFNILAP